MVALNYFALGDNAQERGAGYIKDYYGFLGPWADQIAQGISSTPERIKDVARQFSDLGFTELIFDPTIPEVSQVDMLADLGI